MADNSLLPYTKMTSRLTRLIYLFCSVFPLLAAAILAGWALCIGSPGMAFNHPFSFYFLPEFPSLIGPGLVVFSLYLAAVGIFCRLTTFIYAKTSKDWLIPALIFLIAIGVRMIIPLVFADRLCLFSDFQEAWARAIGNISANDRHQFFPAYVNFSLFLKLLTDIFGKHVLVDILSGVIFNGITALMLFKVADNLYEKKSLALIATGLYVFNPALIAYSLMGTPEHLCIATLLIATFFFIRAIKRPANLRTILLVAFAALAFGMGSAVKPFHSVVMIAMIAILSLCATEARSRFQRFLLAVSCVVVFVLPLTSIKLVTIASEHVFKLDFSHLQVELHFLNVGLRRDGEGQIHLGENGRQWIADMQNGKSSDEARNSVWHRLETGWHGHYDEIPSFLAKKTIWAWQDFNTPFFYLDTLMGTPSSPSYRQIKTFIVNYMTSGAQISYFLIMLLSALSTFLHATRFKVPGLPRLFLILLILGYSCMLLLSEAQSRYKCLVLPFLFVLTADGIELIQNKLKCDKQSNKADISP